MSADFPQPAVEHNDNNHKLVRESDPVGAVHEEPVPEGNGACPSIKTERAGNCLSCGARAVIKNIDGEYCKDCMRIHLLEKMLVQFTNLQKPK